MIRHYEKITKYLLIIWIVSLIVFDVIMYAVSEYLNEPNIFKIATKVPAILAIVYLGYVIFTTIGIGTILRKAHYCIIIILMAIISSIPIPLIHKYFKGTTPITQGEALTFYGQYIAFLGMFALGYFIYVNDEKHRIEDKKSKCKLLMNCLDKADLDMMRVARYGFQPHQIVYDCNWREYYLAFESLTKRKYSEAKNTIDEFFDTVDLINQKLAEDNYEAAKRLFENHVLHDCYSTRKYNLLELKMLIQNATYINELAIRMNLQPWEKKPEVKKLITVYSEKFFWIVENYIYNHMIKNNKDVIDSTEIERQVVDWLSTNPNICESVKWPSEKRVVAKIVFNISLQLDKKSSKLSYCWGEYILK